MVALQQKVQGAHAKQLEFFVKLQCFYASLNFLSNFIGLNYSLKITLMQSKFQKDFQSKQ